MWTELEQKLRADLEELMSKNEELDKALTEEQIKGKKNDRLLRSKQLELEHFKREYDNLSDQVDSLEGKLTEANLDEKKVKEKMEAMERSTNEASLNIRNEMMKTVMDSEKRHEEEIAEYSRKLRQSAEERSQLEEKLESLLESTSNMLSLSPSKMDSTSAIGSVTDQVSILENTLSGLDDPLEAKDSSLNNSDGINDGVIPLSSTNSSSFVAMEHLSQTLRASKLEMEALRKQLRISEEAREALQEDLAAARVAAEKLPFFEHRVKELTIDLEEKQMDIDEVRENMMEVKEMYRAQLDNLLEEKVANTPI